MARQMFASELGHENLNEPHAHYQDSISISVPDEITVHTPNNVISGDAAFDLRSWIENRNFLEQTRGVEPKSLGLAWHEVAVLAPPGTRAAFVHTLPIAILNTFGPDAFRIASGAFHSVQEDSMRKLIRGHTGVLKDGEMLLVLGRPGSGCSTFLKAISSSLPPNVTLHPASKISYGGLPPSEIMGDLRGEVIYSGEEDIHIPALTVADTFRFALRSKVPTRDKRPVGESRQQFVESTLDVFLKMFGISHVRDTIVGDAYKRGVSGGERKRVSIAEVLACRAAITCWDNSTRGLDANTALEYVRSLRLSTDLRRTSATLATLYQVSETIYDQFDRVLLVDEGRCVYYGPRDRARRYFQGLGYYAPERQTTADFLTSVTDPNEVMYDSEYKGRSPRTAEEREIAWKRSSLYADLLQELKEDIVRVQKNRRVPKTSRYTVSFAEQVKSLTIRQLLIKWESRNDMYIKYFTIFSVSLMISSVFYGESQTTAGVFTRGGVLLESLDAVSGRPVIAKHRQFGFHRPSAVIVARALTDIPFLVVQCTVTSLIIYFMANLRRDAGAFFIYLLYVFLTTYNLTALYRLFAVFSPSFHTAIRFAVLGLSEYVIHRPQMGWLTFMSYIQGIAYGYEGLVVNELAFAMNCDPSTIVPFGEARDIAYQTCILPGSRAGSLLVQGGDYLRESFGYSHHHLWRNVGVMIAFTILYVVLTMIGAEILDFGGDVGGITIFAKTTRTKALARSLGPAVPDDPEAGPVKSEPGSWRNLQRDPYLTRSKLPKKSVPVSLESRPIFTFKDVNYSIGDKAVLRHINGWVRPGQLTALMGVSGAGKTTLLTSLSQRQESGILTGELLVDGKPLDAGFQKSTGLCLQSDVHLPSSTVREAVTFSALLRQPREVSREEKLAEVDRTLRLLELDDLQDALVPTLTIEQRKRVTIAVELAAKPELLLFLDEPTSGLDSAGAASIIHQPSALLFQSFDQLLLLSNRGQAVYFGPIGDTLGDSNVVRSYFENNGATPCPPSANVAEYILDVASGEGAHKIDWAERWENSINAAQVKQEINEIKLQRAGRPKASDPRLLREFSSSIYTQIVETTKRQFIDMYRDPSYAYGILFSNTLVGLIMGLAFHHIGDGILIILLNFPAVVNAMMAKFMQYRNLYEAREGPSKTYSWIAFMTAFVIISCIHFRASVIYFLPSFFIPFYKRDTYVAGFAFLMIITFNLFAIFFSIALAAGAPTPTAATYILPFLLSSFFVVNGVIVPKNKIVTPFGQTCAAYAGSWAAASTGYLTNPNSTSDCGYCHYRNGDQYLATLSIKYSEHWRDFGAFFFT
ncbi:hypothetical protein BS47DRAFT_1374048 [Hydnum rufescens UP504]|uniref:ABC transporter domain-containing protein n=1 Tax=Hydnum rufescens UP504 TaxID=1448309 RepID=A0A9P6AL12_9AGAM|nr:hypothetical protein BS47DRAFT_1374048 [Hydnum rufescens UP504]